MENNIYIIEDKFNKLSQNLLFKSIEFTPDLITDNKIDEWVQNILFGLNPTIEKLIIPIRLGYEDTECIGLRIGLHIRLTKELNEKRYIPILFVSINETKEEIVSNQITNNLLLTSLILFTPGTKLIDLFDLNETIINPLIKIDDTILKNEVLPKLIIPNERGSGHQLSNEWGALRLAKLARIKLNTLSKPTDLYFKYKFAYSDFDITATEMNKVGTIRKDCKFLIIDDNTKNGWEELISHIINSELINKFVNRTIGSSILDFEEAMSYPDFESHDIIFLDLRLKKEEENIQNESIHQLSGVQILKEIKSINKGIQVVIITASNKAWNMKALLNEGADGYFIKESIDVTLSESTSQQNYEDFILSIKTAFNRNYLKKIFTSIDKLKIKLNHLIGVYDQEFLDEIQILLDQSFDMHYNAKNDKQFAYAYVTLYMIIEIINQKFITKQNDDTYVIIDVGNLLDWKYENKKYSNNDIAVKGNKPPEWQKITGLYFQKWNKTEEDFIQKTYSLIRKRNGFVHNDKSILDKKNNAGKYINRDVFNKDGFVELFNCIEILINLL